MLNDSSHDTVLSNLIKQIQQGVSSSMTYFEISYQYLERNTQPKKTYPDWKFVSKSHSQNIVNKKTNLLLGKSSISS
jgi:hypothetical protein